MRFNDGCLGNNPWDEALRGITKRSRPRVPRCEASVLSSQQESPTRLA